MRCSMLAVAVLVLTLPLRANAQNLVVTIPGVVNAGALATFVTCTALNAAQTITLQVTDQHGSAAGT